MEAKEVMATEEFANFIVTARYEDFTTEVKHIAKRCIIDGIGVILAGSMEPCAQIARKYALSMEGREESTIIGKGKTQVPVHLAALVNGMAGHAMDWDDTAISSTSDKAVLLHPTLPPLATSLALGEKLKVTGRDLLMAFLIGFEVECKIGEACHPDYVSRGFHTSNTFGIFGATAAAAKLMGLTVKQIRSAFGIAGSLAGGIRVNTGTMGKPLHVGRAAENGIVAAQLSALAFEAHPNALEGNGGFFQVFAGGFDPNVITGKLGRPFSIVNPGVCIKSYPCGVVGQPTMDAMRALVIQHDIQPAEVGHVKVATGSHVLRPLRYKKAQTALQGKFCLPFQMASMIIHRKAGIMEFTDEFVQDPAVQEMMDRVEGVADPEIFALGQNKLISVIEIQMKDGRILRGRTSEEYRGGPDNPLSRDELAEKFNDCVRRVLNPDQAGRLMERLESLESVDDVRTLIDMAVVP